ncbi:MAG: hypothetical protein AAFQ54_10015 [Pseudomonadota bacterium]
MTAFLIAASLSLAWALVHTFVGEREVARPLRAVSMPHTARATAWMCWHYVTVALFLMFAFFLAAALGEAGLGLAATLLAAAFFLTGLWAKVATGESFARLPQGWLFLPVMLSGIWGLLA